MFLANWVSIFSRSGLIHENVVSMILNSGNALNTHLWIFFIVLAVVCIRLLFLHYVWLLRMVGAGKKTDGIMNPMFLCCVGLVSKTAENSLSEIGVFFS